MGSAVWLLALGVGCRSPAGDGSTWDLPRPTTPTTPTSPSPTGDTGIHSDCVAATARRLPAEPQVDVDRVPLLWKGTASCEDDTWELWAQSSTYYAAFHENGSDAPLDGVTFQAWDLVTGTMAFEVPAQPTNGQTTSAGYIVDWVASVPAEPSCAEAATHLSVLVTGVQEGIDLRPRQLWDAADGLLVGTALVTGEGRWEQYVSADGADEVWLWALFLHQEAYGPFPVVRRAQTLAGGDWSWRIDDETERLLNVEDGVLGIVACLDGAPMDTYANSKL